MEIWDAYYADGSKAGVDLVRGEKIPDGLFHLCSEILVRHTDGEYLLMQRDYGKATFPGYFEATAGGSALKGESAYDCAVRELREETGIVPITLEEVSVYISDSTIYHCFVALTDCDKGCIRLQEGETVSCKWLDEGELVRFINSDEVIPFQRRHFAVYYARIGYLRGHTILRVSEATEYAEALAEAMHGWWGIPLEAYRESIGEAIGNAKKRATGNGDTQTAVPEWYIVVDGGRIVGGAGVIENDFHPRRDLAPNLCALYVAESHRKRGIAGELLIHITENMHRRGVDTLYLLTDHECFYERYGWEYLCPVTSDGEESPSRMYVHRYKAK